MTPCGSNVYTNPNMEIIYPSINVPDLGIYMSSVTAPLIIIFLVCLKSVLICQDGF